MARVIPIFKNGKRNISGNYRPIYILPAISEVMERILYTQLYSYFTDTIYFLKINLVLEKNHSTTTALLDWKTLQFSRINRPQKGF